ncbi:MAG: hypothetical protein ACXU9C_22975 [Xanthobacteraceae bacterium]
MKTPSADDLLAVEQFLLRGVVDLGGGLRLDRAARTDQQDSACQNESAHHRFLRFIFGAHANVQSKPYRSRYRDISRKWPTRHAQA